MPLPKNRPTSPLTSRGAVDPVQSPATSVTVPLRRPRQEPVTLFPTSPIGTRGSAVPEKRKR